MIDRSTLIYRSIIKYMQSGKHTYFSLSVYHSMMDSSKHDYYEYFGRVHGILMYKDFIKYWDDVEAFEARADDIVIATYPKSGKFKLLPFVVEMTNPSWMITIKLSISSKIILHIK